MKILLIGGFGNTREYMSPFINSCLGKHVVIFYEFKIDKTIDHKHEIIDLIEKHAPHTIMAFSMSCHLVYTIVKDLQHTKLILIDPPNIGHLLRDGDKRTSTYYMPFRTSGKRSYSEFSLILNGGIIAGIIFALSKVKWIREFFNTFVFRETGPIHMVNDCVLQCKLDNVQHMLQKYLMDMGPLKMCANQNKIVHVVSGTKSQYFEFNKRLSEDNVMVKLHVVKGGSHHLLWEGANIIWLLLGRFCGSERNTLKSC